MLRVDRDDESGSNQPLEVSEHDNPFWFLIRRGAFVGRVEGHILGREWKESGKLTKDSTFHRWKTGT
jgi:hypothetical protein